MRTVEKIENRLWSLAQYRASDFGFASDCQGLVMGLIRDGVKRIEYEGVLDNDNQIALAEANLSSFILEMIIEAEKLGMNELHENTFGKAHQSLCPIWPFC